MQQKRHAWEKAKKIKLVIFDVDGVLTDGGIYIGEQGELFKPFFCRDGLGMTLARRAGLKTAIITGRASNAVLLRAQRLEVSEVYQGNLDKRSAYAELKQKLDVQDDEVAYIGDDLVDLPVMLQVGLPLAVGDAVDEVKAAAEVVSDLPGGHGAVRQLLEFLLKAQGKWEELLQSFFAPDAGKKLAQ